jgi:ATP-binding cassette subfamily B protein
MPRQHIDIDDYQNREMHDSEIIKRLLNYVKPYKKPVVISFLFVIMIVGLDLLGPYLVGKVIDALGMDVIPKTNILIIVIVYLISLGLLAFFSYKQRIILQMTGQKIIYNIRRDVFNHMERLSTAQFNSIPIGKLVTRVTSDIDRLNMLYTDIVVSVLRDILMVFGVFGFMAILSPKLTLWVMGIVPLIFIASYIFRRFARKAYRKVRKNVSIINAFLSEHLSGMKLIQIFNREEKKYQEFHDKNNVLKRSYYQEILTFSLYRPFMYVLYIVGMVIVLWRGTDLVLKGYITFGTLYAFTVYVRRFFQPIQNLAAQFNTLQAAFTSGERIFDILDTVPEVQDHEEAIELNQVKGKIEFKNVWFAYEEDDWVLKDVSFVVEPNQTMALVGATGSGKTTIIKLIARNYDIQKGQILLDDIDITKIKLSSLRSKIGQMLQDVFLFSGTIESNIRLKDENITDRDVLSASQYVNADQFIQKLPNKYDELVRERGNNFSSGQRQLLSFARTIVHHPQIMILDEATANIDTETEMLIQESLKKIMTIGTMIIVAHRLSTIQHADNIIVMQKGRIIEQGNHQNLLKQKGHYYQLYRLQYDQEIDDETTE